ncbi:MAG TPA: hypothetical protein VFQ42_03945 [Mycobacterium sp.]|nr:hypothetical protein [Mycobacterium sp.]
MSTDAEAPVARWTVPTSNGNGEAVIEVEPGRPINLSYECPYSDEPTEFDPDAVEDLRAKLGFAVGVSRGAIGGETL